MISAVPAKARTHEYRILNVHGSRLGALLGRLTGTTKIEDTPQNVVQSPDRSNAAAAR
jgi:hypothetical protein